MNFLIGKVYDNPVAYFSFVLAIISLAWQAYSRLRENRIVVKVYQQGTNVTNSIRHVKGMTFLQLDVAVINASPKATAVICGWDVQLPWRDEFLEITPDPKGVEQDNLYRFSNDRMATCPREGVLNHRTYEDGVLTQSAPVMKGTLLARGGSPVPNDVQQEMEVKVIVWDQKGTRHGGKFKVRIDRFHQDRDVLPDGKDLLHG